MQLNPLLKNVLINIITSFRGISPSLILNHCKYLKYNLIKCKDKEILCNYVNINFYPVKYFGR
jgi:hypothetical protein